MTKDQISYKDRTIRIIACDLSLEAPKAKRAFEDVVQTVREHTCQFKLLYQQNFKTKQMKIYMRYASTSRIYLEIQAHISPQKEDVNLKWLTKLKGTQIINNTRLPSQNKGYSPPKLQKSIHTVHP